jgi:hypothetical protein
MDTSGTPSRRRLGAVLVVALAVSPVLAPRPVPAVEPGATLAEVVGPVTSAGPGFEPEPRVVMHPGEAAAESLLGDVYRKGTWRPQSWRALFTEGWDEPWAAGPAGRAGRTPRHGWLGNDAGLFYRLWHTNLTYAHGLDTAYGGDQYTGTHNIFFPLSRRLELRLDTPFVVSNGTVDPRQGYTSQFGDLLIAPRVLLAETEATSHLFALDIRTPTGTTLTGNGVMSLTPRYEFWANPFGPWVVRGMGGIGVPLNRPNDVSNIAYVVGIPSNRTSVPDQATFHGSLALGRYVTGNIGRFGDMVFYTAASWRIPLEGDVSTTFVSVGPGTRFEIAKKTFVLGFFEVPLTAPRVVDYLLQLSIMRVW